MKTDLSELFQKLSVVRNGHYDPFPKIVDDYNRYLAAVRNSHSSRLHTRVNKASELWSSARVGVVLCDALTVSGSSPSGLNREVRILISTIGSDNPLRYIDPEVLKAIGHKRPALGFFADDVIAEWLDDAAPFIEDGRLLYIPQRMEVSVPKDNREIKFNANSIADSVLEVGLETILQADQEKSVALISSDSLKLTKCVTADWLNIINVALPYINDIPLKTLHKVLIDEEDTLVEFRKIISSVLPTYISSTAKTEDSNQLLRVGIEIRRDLIEPEIAKLNKSFKKIIQVRAINVAGATLSTVLLSMAAISNGSLINSIPLIVGAGGIGAVTREYANYRSELLALKDNPWHFAWQLKQQAKQ